VTLSGGVDPASLKRTLERIRGTTTKARDGMRNAFERSGARWQGAVRGRFNTGSTGPRSLHSRTGFLGRAVKYDVKGSALGDLKLSMRVAGASYARMQEFGGEIKPKNAKFLTIPTSFNKKASGATDFPSARALIAAKEGQTFFRRTAKGHLFLFWDKFEKKSVRARTRKFSDIRGGSVAKNAPVPMFLLVKKVDLPGPNSPSKRGPSRLGAHDEAKSEREGKLGKDLRKIGADIAADISSGGA